MAERPPKSMLYFTGKDMVFRRMIVQQSLSTNFTLVRKPKLKNKQEKTFHHSSYRSNLQPEPCGRTIAIIFNQNNLNEHEFVNDDSLNLNLLIHWQVSGKKN